MLQHRFYPSP